MSATPWIVGGIVASVAIVGFVWYRNQQMQDERERALQASGLTGLGNGVDQSRADITAGLQAVGQLFQFGTQVAKTVGEENARQAAAQTTRSSATTQPTTRSSATGSSGKGLLS